MEKKLLQIINYYGIRSQQRKLNEEVFELIEAINVYEEQKVVCELCCKRLHTDKEKEHIVLWNDFLIYAVLLEENENIINDINKYKNINLNILNNISLLDD